MTATWMLVATAAFVTAAMFVGWSAQRGRIGERQRWLHHAIFFGAIASAAGAAILHLQDRHLTTVPLVVLIGALAALPLTRPGGRAHVAGAMLAATSVAVAVGTRWMLS